MCENIYEMTIIFTVEFVDQNEEIQLIRVPVLSSAGGINSVGEFSIKGNEILADGQRSQYSDGRVTGVDLSITVLSDTGVRLIRRVPFETPEQRAEFLSENSYHYSRSIILPQP